MCAETSPARAASNSFPLPLWRIITRLQSASTPSSAASTRMPSCASRSRPVPADSPTRRTVSCSRARSSPSSSRRDSSSRAMSLNSRPSSANSSWPSVGTATEKSPLPSLRAASSRRLICAWSERAAVRAKASAQIRKANRTSTITTVLSGTASALASAGASRRTVTGASPNPGVRNPRTLYCSPASSASPLSGRPRPLATSTVPARISSPSVTSTSSAVASSTVRA